MNANSLADIERLVKVRIGSELWDLKLQKNLQSHLACLSYCSMIHCFNKKSLLWEPLCIKKLLQDGQRIFDHHFLRDFFELRDYNIFNLRDYVSKWCQEVNLYIMIRGLETWFLSFLIFKRGIKEINNSLSSHHFGMMYVSNNHSFSVFKVTKHKYFELIQFVQIKIF